MALSEQERRSLDDIDHALSTEEPRLAEALRMARWPTWSLSRRRPHVARPSSHSRKAVLLSALGMLLAGLALLIAGLLVHSGPGGVLAVVGYAVIVAASYLTGANLRRWRSPDLRD